MTHLLGLDLRQTDGVRRRLLEAGHQRRQDRARRADELGHAVAAGVRHPDVAGGVDCHAVGPLKLAPLGAKLPTRPPLEVNSVTLLPLPFVTQTLPAASIATPSGR